MLQVLRVSFGIKWSRVVVCLKQNLHSYLLASPLRLGEIEWNLNSTHFLPSEDVIVLCVCVCVCEKCRQFLLW